MSTRILLWFLILIIFSACRKSNYAEPVVPVIPDSLYQWKEIGQIPDSYADDIFFTSPASGYMVGNQIFQTRDSGRTWTAVPGSSVTTGLFNLFFTDSNYGFAEGSSQMAFTTDGGSTWKIKPLRSPGAFTLFFVNSAVGFYGDNTGGGLYKTTDGGNNWTSVFNVPSVPDNFYPYFLNQDTGFVATNSGVFAGTTDGGLTWNTKNNITNPSSSGTYNQLQFLNAKDGYYGCHVGVMKTTDGGQTWNNILPGETGNNVNVIKFFDTQSGYYKGSTTIYHTTDAGQTWTISCRIGSGFFIGMNFLDAHTGWVCTAKGRVFRIQD